jgi:hypothetical protein
MQINLNVLGPLVLNGVGGQVNGNNIIAVHNSGMLKRAMELVQQLTQPTRLGDSIGNRTILNLRTGSGNCCLMLGRPGNEIVPQEDVVPRGRTAGVGATSPINIKIYSEINRRGWN